MFEAICFLFPIITSLKLIFFAFYSACFSENKMKLVLFDLFLYESLI